MAFILRLLTNSGWTDLPPLDRHPRSRVSIHGRRHDNISQAWRLERRDITLLPRYEEAPEDHNDSDAAHRPAAA